MLHDLFQTKFGILLFMTGAALNMAACSMDDSDRCVSGYTYDPSTKSCQMDRDDMGVAGDDAEVADGGAVDDGTVDDDSGVDLSALGFGVACYEAGAAAECADFEEATYCALPTGETEGQCTKEGCTLDDTESCPGDLVCCDCSDFTTILCVSEERSKEISAFCTCADAE